MINQWGLGLGYTHWAGQAPPWNWSSMIKAFYLCAYARQPARGPTMWAHFVAILAYVGLCWPILRAMWAHVVAMLASCWFMLSQKIRKMGTAKKHCKTQGILMVGGLSWGYVGPSWGYVGLSWGQCGPTGVPAGVPCLLLPFEFILENHKLFLCGPTLSLYPFGMLDNGFFMAIEWSIHSDFVCWGGSLGGPPCGGSASLSSACGGWALWVLERSWFWLSSLVSLVLKAGFALSGVQGGFGKSCHSGLTS